MLAELVQVQDFDRTNLPVERDLCSPTIQRLFLLLDAEERCPGVHDSLDGSDVSQPKAIQ
jgi:hypothetical protein